MFNPKKLPVFFLFLFFLWERGTLVAQSFFSLLKSSDQLITCLQKIFLVFQGQSDFVNQNVSNMVNSYSKLTILFSSMKVVLKH